MNPVEELILADIKVSGYGEYKVSLIEHGFGSLDGFGLFCQKNGLSFEDFYSNLVRVYKPDISMKIK